MNWQTRTNSRTGFNRTFWVILCFSATILALKQTTFGKNSVYRVTHRLVKTSIKLVLMLLVLFIMILLEVRFSA